MITVSFESGFESDELYFFTAFIVGTALDLFFFFLMQEPKCFARL